MVDIKPEWIEKAAEEINAEKHGYRVDRSTWTPYCTCGWSGESAHDVAAYTRHLAALALEAVADDIRAEGAVKALRDAERDLTKPRFISSENREPLSTRMSSTDVADWLTRRAERIEARDE